MNTGNLFAQAAGFALIAACYPPAILIAALYLASERPGRTAVLYLAGGIAIVTAVGVAALVAIRAGGLSQLGHHHHQTRYGLRLGLGVLAIIAAAVLWQRKPKAGKPDRSGMIRRLSARQTPLAAFAVGVLMFGPSLTFLAAVQVIATARTSLADTIGAMAMVVLLTVAFAWLPLVAYAVAPRRTVSLLRSADGWTKRHGRTLLISAIALIGVLLAIQGIIGLT
jgi:hypothetical protein